MSSTAKKTAPQSLEEFLSNPETYEDFSRRFYKKIAGFALKNHADLVLSTLEAKFNKMPDIGFGDIYDLINIIQLVKTNEHSIFHYLQDRNDIHSDIVNSSTFVDLMKLGSDDIYIRFFESRINALDKFHSFNISNILSRAIKVKKGTSDLSPTFIASVVQCMRHLFSLTAYDITIVKTLVFGLKHYKVEAFRDLVNEYYPLYFNNFALFAPHRKRQHIPTITNMIRVCKDPALKSKLVGAAMLTKDAELIKKVSGINKKIGKRVTKLGTML